MSACSRRTREPAGSGQPMALLVTVWFDALLEVRLGDVDRVAMIADEMRALVDEYALAQGKAAWRWFRGWADARKGKALEGFRQIRDAHDENTALGMMAGASENLGYAAEALLLHGDWHAAQEQLDQALEIVETYGERIYLPQLLLIEGAIAHARGEPDAAIASIRRAIGRGSSTGRDLARTAGAHRALRARSRDGRGSTRARRAGRPARRGKRHDRARQSASPARGRVVGLITADVSDRTATFP